MEFRVLGPLHVLRDGEPVNLDTARKPRLLLAAMLVYAGRPVPLTEVLSAVWGEHPPASAVKNLQLYAHKVRLTLGVERVPYGPARLCWAPGDLMDAQQFRRLTTEAAMLDGGDLLRASARLRTALDLWRGPAFLGLDEGLIGDEARRLEEERLIAYERWAETQLQLGHADAVVTEFTAMLRAHPYREKMRALLMRALHVGGRTVEALELYRTTRAQLVEELGIEPGPELQTQHASILRGEPVPPVGNAGGTTPIDISVGQPASTPRELVRGPVPFVGRQSLIRRLDELLAKDVAAGSESSNLAVIAGPAGVGKTALAVHWAHRVADGFADGQCVVDLRGFDATQQALAPSDALRGLLETLGVPGDRIPLDVDARSRLFRSLVAERRMLFLFDNVRDAEQVRPLIPAAPRSFVLITSRNELPGLIASHGAHPMTVEVLRESEANELLAARLGRDRLVREPAAAAELVDRCGGLPLALVIVAARASRAGLALSDVVTRLRSARPVLDAFSTDDLATDVRAVFSWSYQALSPQAADLFRVLGLHPGPELSLAAAASLAGMDLRTVSLCLGEVSRVSLVTEPGLHRYAMHDLVRSYATELAEAHDPAIGRRRASLRMLEHYLHAAYVADRLLYPHRHWIALGAMKPQVVIAHIGTHDQAMEWFRAEHRTLVAMVNLAVRLEHDQHAWLLAGAALTFFDRHSQWDQMYKTHVAALDAATRLDDPHALAFVHHALGLANRGLERFDDAYKHYSQAIEYFAAAGDAVGRAHAHLNRALGLEQQGRVDDALRDAEQSLVLFRSIRHRSGEAKALNAVGWYEALQGHYEQSLRHCEEALTITTDLGDVFGQALTWDSIGLGHHGLAQYDSAIAAYERSAELWERLGDRSVLAAVLTRLGATHHAAEDLDRARQRWTQAWNIYTSLGHPDAETVRARLNGGIGS